MYYPIWTVMDKVRQVKRREQPLLIRVDEAARLLGCSRAKLYIKISSGEIESVLWGGQRLLPRDAVDAYVRRLRGLDPLPSNGKTAMPPPTV
jgi:excisionase family DNA binding protein